MKVDKIRVDIVTLFAKFCLITLTYYRKWTVFAGSAAVRQEC